MATKQSLLLLNHIIDGFDGVNDDKQSQSLNVTISIKNELLINTLKLKDTEMISKQITNYIEDNIGSVIQWISDKNNTVNHNEDDNNDKKEEIADLNSEANHEPQVKVLCKYYTSPTGCKYGNSCRFIHDMDIYKNDDGEKENTTNNSTCAFYGAAMGCRNGELCRYNHNNPNSVPYCLSMQSDRFCVYGNRCKFRHKHYVSGVYQNVFYPPNAPIQNQKPIITKLKSEYSQTIDHSDSEHGDHESSYKILQSLMNINRSERTTYLIDGYIKPIQQILFQKSKNKKDGFDRYIPDDITKLVEIFYCLIEDKWSTNPKHPAIVIENSKVTKPYHAHSSVNVWLENIVKNGRNKWIFEWKGNSKECRLSIGIWCNNVPINQLILKDEMGSKPNSSYIFNVSQAHTNIHYKDYSWTDKNTYCNYGTNILSANKYYTQRVKIEMNVDLSNTTMKYGTLGFSVNNEDFGKSHDIKKGENIEYRAVVGMYWPNESFGPLKISPSITLKAYTFTP